MFLFTTTGYTNWQNALDKPEGFAQHASSKTHLSAIAYWKEASEVRADAKQEIFTLLNEKQLERKKHSVSPIFQLIQFI